MDTARVASSLDPSSSLSTEQLAAWVRMYTAGMAGFYPDDVDVSAFFLESWRVPEHASTALLTLAGALVRKLHEPTWWAESVEGLWRADAAQYAVARSLAREWPVAKPLMGIVRHGAEMLYPRLSLHQRQRLGPWKRPTLATRAFIVGTGVHFLEFVRNGMMARQAQLGT